MKNVQSSPTTRHLQSLKTTGEVNKLIDALEDTINEDIYQQMRFKRKLRKYRQMREKIMVSMAEKQAVIEALHKMIPQITDATLKEKKEYQRKELTFQLEILEDRLEKYTAEKIVNLEFQLQRANNNLAMSRQHLIDAQQRLEELTPVSTNENEQVTTLETPLIFEARRAGLLLREIRKTPAAKIFALSGQKENHLEQKIAAVG